MTWADLVRKSSPPMAPAPSQSAPAPLRDAATARQVNHALCPVLRLPGDAWGLILDFSPLPAVCNVGAVCHRLYGVHGRAHVWERKMAEHEVHVAELRGAGTGLIPLGAPGVDNMKHQLVRSACLEARDFERDLELREWTQAHGHTVLSRRLHQLNPRQHGVTLDSIAVLQLARPAVDTHIPPLLDSAVNTMSLAHSGGRDLTAAALRTIIDHLQAGLPVEAAADMTDCEVGSFVALLLDALAVDRIAPEVHCGRNLRLLELRQHELLALLGSDAEEWALAALAMFVAAPELTRFFTGPELCRDGRLGAIAVDPVRLLLLRPLCVH